MSLDLLRHTFCNESSGLQVITWFVLYAVPNEHCWYIPPTSGHELWSAIKFYTCLYFSASKTSSVYTNSSLAGFGVEAFGDRKWTKYIATANVSLCWPLSRFLPFPGICLVVGDSCTAPYLHPQYIINWKLVYDHEGTSGYVIESWKRLQWAPLQIMDFQILSHSACWPATSFIIFIPALPMIFLGTPLIQIAPYDEASIFLVRLAKLICYCMLAAALLNLISVSMFFQSSCILIWGSSCIRCVDDQVPCYFAS